MSTREKDIEAALAQIRGGVAQGSEADSIDAALAEIRRRPMPSEPRPRPRRQVGPVRRAVNWFFGGIDEDPEVGMPAAPAQRALPPAPAGAAEQGRRIHDAASRVDPSGTRAADIGLMEALARSQRTPAQRLAEADPSTAVARSDATSTAPTRARERREALRRAPQGSVGPDERNDLARRLAEGRADRVAALARRPSVVRKADAFFGEGAQSLTLGYRDEIMGALSPTATAEDFEAMAAERRDSRTTGDTVAGVAGAIVGAAVPIGGQNALLARAARFAPEGTAVRAGLEAFGHTGARTLAGDMIRGAAEGIPYDLAYDYDNPDERTFNLAVGLAGGAVAGGVFRSHAKRPGADARPAIDHPMSHDPLAVPEWVRGGQGAPRTKAPVTADEMRVLANTGNADVRQEAQTLAGLLDEGRSIAPYVAAMSPDLRRAVEEGLSRVREVPDTDWLHDVEWLGSRAQERARSAPQSPVAPVPAPSTLAEPPVAAVAQPSVHNGALDVARQIADAGERPSVPRVMREAGVSEAEARAAVRRLREGDVPVVPRDPAMDGATPNADGDGAVAPSPAPPASPSIGVRSNLSSQSIGELVAEVSRRRSTFRSSILDEIDSGRPVEVSDGTRVALLSKEPDGSGRYRVTGAVGDLTHGVPPKRGAGGFGDPAAFHSRLDRSINEFPQEKATPQQWRAFLRERTSKSEREWTGMDAFLDDAEKRGVQVTRQEIRALYDENAIQLQEVVRAAPRPNLRSKYALPEVRRVLTRAGASEDDLLLTLANDGDAYRALMRRFPDLEENEDWAELVVNDVFGTTTNPAKYSEHQLPGGKDYREVLVTLPETPPSTKGWTAKESAGDPASGPTWDVRDQNGRWVLGVPRQGRTAEDAIAHAAKRERPTGYRSSHWDEPNVLLHLRMNDRTLPNGERVLFVEEMQSDWHQQGRKRGYNVRSDIPPVDTDLPVGWSIMHRAEATGDPVSPESVWVLDGRTDFVAGGATVEEAIRNAGIDQAAKTVDGAPKPFARYRSTPYSTQTGVPDAPFKKADEWMGLGMKRVLDEAAAGGYDRVAWTTGAQQADRYDLSKQIDELLYTSRGDGSYDIEALRDGEPLSSQHGLTPEALEAHVGKDVAQRIINGDGAPVRGSDTRSLTGTNLRVGGEGMRSFYDRMIPNWVKDYARRLGVKVDVEPVSAAGVISGNPSVRITPELRQRLTAGQSIGAADPAVVRHMAGAGAGAAVGAAADDENPARGALVGAAAGAGLSVVVGQVADLALRMQRAGRRLPMDVDARFPGVGQVRASAPTVDAMVGVLARSSVGAALGATQGDTPEERLTNAALFGALGAGAPQLYRYLRGMDQIGAVGPRDPAGRARFYSRLEQAIAGGQKSASGHQWLRYLDNRPEGIAKGEREWTGVDEFLRSRGDERVTREELAQHMAEHRIVVGEVVRGHAPPNPEAQQWVEKLRPQSDRARADLLGRMQGTYGETGREWLLSRLDMGYTPEEIVQRTPGAADRLAEWAPEIERYRKYSAALRQAEAVADPAAGFNRARDVRYQAERDLRDAIDDVGGRNNDRAHNLRYLGTDPEAATRYILSTLGDSHPTVRRAAAGIVDPEVGRLTLAIRKFVEATEAFREAEAAHEATRPRYSTFTVPGGDKYREVLLTMPTREVSAIDPHGPEMRAEVVRAYEDYMDRAGYTPEERATYLPIARSDPREVVPEEVIREAYAKHGFSPEGERLEPRERVYKSPHWDEPNVLAHIRMDDRTLPSGERVLFVHEIQSDWHQAGREQGYASLDDYRRRVLEAVRAEGRYTEDEVREALEHIIESPMDSAARPTGWAWKVLSDATSGQDVDLNAIHEIRDGGRYAPPPDAPFKGTQEWAGLAMKRVVDEAVAGGYDRVAWSTGKQIQQIVGGVEEGQSEFYDQILPRWVEKYIRKTGGKLEQVEVPTGRVEGEASRHRYVGPELTDDVLRRAQDRARLHEVEELLDEIREVDGADQRAHVLTSRLAAVGETYPEVRDEVLRVLRGRMEEAATSSAPTNPSFRITPQMRTAVGAKGQVLYSFPGPFLDAFKGTAGQAAAAAGLGAAVDQDHPLRGALVGAGAVIGIKAGMLGKTVGRLARAERTGTLRTMLDALDDQELGALAKRMERFNPRMAQAVSGEIEERALRASLTPEEVADRDIELLARGPLRPLRERPGRALATKEREAIVEAYQQGDREIRHRIVDEIEQAMDVAGPAQADTYNRLIDSLETEGYGNTPVPLPARADSGIDARRHVNLGTFALDPMGESRLADHVRRVVEAEGLDPKTPVTWDQVREVARDIGVSPNEVAFVGKDGAGRMSGAQMLAIRNQIRENVQGIEEISRQLAMFGETMPDAQREMLERIVGEAEAQNSSLLSQFVRSRTQAGRDLNSLKILANQTLDPMLWEARAAKLLRRAGLAFTEEHRAAIRSILAECQ